jgi:predicted RNase H-like nuclease (RuvC/YqgF family)
MKSEIKTDLSNIKDKINKTVNVLKSENVKLHQENVCMKQELLKLTVKLDRLEGHSRLKNNDFLVLKALFL